MPSYTSTVGALLKEQVEPGIVNQLNNDTAILDSFSNETDTAILGTAKVRGIRVNRNRGGYYTAEGGAPPVPGTVEIQRLVIPERYYHHAMGFSEQVLNASRSNEGAFADAYRLGVEDVQDGLKRKRNQSLWGWGTGIAALVNGAASSTTQTLDAPGGIAGADDGNRFLNVGDWVGFVNPNGNLRLTTAHKVTGLTGSTQITISPTASTTDNDYLVSCVETSGTLTIGNTSYMHPPMGLWGMADNGTYINSYFGLSRTTWPILNSVVISVGTALSADVIQRALDLSHKGGGAQTDEIWLESAVKRAYLRMMQSDRRYTASELMTPDAGTVAAKTARQRANTGLRFGTIPIMQDPDAPYGGMLGLDRRSLKRYPGPMGWVDRDGQVLRLSSTIVDYWEAFFRCFEQFAAEQPNQLWKLTDIACDVVVAHVY